MSSAVDSSDRTWAGTTLDCEWLPDPLSIRFVAAHSEATAVLIQAMGADPSSVADISATVWQGHHDDMSEAALADYAGDLQAAVLGWMGGSGTPTDDAPPTTAAADPEEADLEEAGDPDEETQAASEFGAVVLPGWLTASLVVASIVLLLPGLFALRTVIDWAGRKLKARGHS